MTEWWVKMVEKVLKKEYGPHWCYLYKKDVVKLLARQHRNIRDKVRTLRNRATWRQFQSLRELVVYRQACDDILAALAKQGASKKKD